VIGSFPAITGVPVIEASTVLKSDQLKHFAPLASFGSTALSI